MTASIIIGNDGRIRTIYNETLDLSPLGIAQIQRASHVEPTSDGRWNADLSPVDGPLLGPFSLRSQAVQAELEWLGQWLILQNQNCNHQLNKERSNSSDSTS